MRSLGMRAALTVLACLCLTACLGKAPPPEEYLRLGQSREACGNVPVKDGVVLAMKPFKAPDNLNRQAVLLARGRVLSPSMRWYWEASPELLAGEAVAADVACLDGFAGAAPYRSRLDHDAGLTGTLSAFNLQEEGGTRFVIALRLELWSANYKRLLASTVIESARPVAAMDAQSVADAASGALAEAASKAGAWLEAARDVIAASNTNGAGAQDQP